MMEKNHPEKHGKVANVGLLILLAIVLWIFASKAFADKPKPVEEEQVQEKIQQAEEKWESIMWDLMAREPQEIEEDPWLEENS